MEKDTRAAPPRSLTDSDLEDLERALRAASPALWTTGNAWHGVQVHDAAAIAAIRNAAPSLISDLRLARQRGDVNWKLAQGEQAARLARDAEWREALALSHFDAFDGLHIDCAECAPLRSLLDTANADASPPSDSSAALLEAHWLLTEAYELLHADGYPRFHKSIVDRIRAFLRSDSERSEPARSESGGSKVVHDPSEEGR